MSHLLFLHPPKLVIVFWDFHNASVEYFVLFFSEVNVGVVKGVVM